MPEKELSSVEAVFQCSGPICGRKPEQDRAIVTRRGLYCSECYKAVSDQERGKKFGVLPQ